MIKKLENLYNELAYVANELHTRHWAERNAGNISVNITSMFNSNELSDFPSGVHWRTVLPYKSLQNQHILVTLSGSRMFDLSNNPSGAFCHIKIDGEGNASILNSINSMQPTSEIYTHLAIQNYFLMGSEQNKVLLHTHPDEIIAMTHLEEFRDTDRLNKVLWNIHPESLQFIPDGVGLIPFTEAGNDDIAEKTLNEFNKHRLVIWEKHGCLACGTTPRDAFDLIDIVSKAARIYLMCKSAGKTIEPLNLD